MFSDFPNLVHHPDFSNRCLGMMPYESDRTALQLR